MSCDAGRDYIHQLAVLNLATCQLLTMLLRTCPRTIGRQAAEVSPLLLLLAGGRVVPVYVCLASSKGGRGGGWAQIHAVGRWIGLAVDVVKRD